MSYTSRALVRLRELLGDKHSDTPDGEVHIDPR